MTFPNAVIHIDDHHVEILRFDAGRSETQRIKAHVHDTKQHGSGVPTEHVDFGAVCDALDSVEAILVVGSHMALADFRHYVAKHRTALAERIVGWRTVDHPTDAQLLALARTHFVAHEGMARTQTRMS